ncbi:MAG: hypothetical protein AAGE93_05045 [Bacteroidota bacterium]
MMTVRSLQYLLIAGLTALLLSCDEEGGDDGPATNDEQQQIERLAKTWIADQVTYDGVNVTSVDFTDFTITFSGDNTWTTEDGDPAFGASGTWEFAEDDLNTVIMNGIPVSITTSTDAALLRLRFTLDNTPVGRTEGITGEYTFDLSAAP